MNQSDNRKTVLIVDDEAEILTLLSQVLKANGYTILEASSGGKALQICKQHTGEIHLIIADVIMAGQLGGLELLQRVVSLRPKIKRMCISGYVDEDMIRQALPDSGTVFLQKPFEPADLLRNVRTLLDVARHA
jgi:two-component system cell cycle sensor histidine kinase/response regulator CckA